MRCQWWERASSMARCHLAPARVRTTGLRAPLFRAGEHVGPPEVGAVARGRAVVCGERGRKRLDFEASRILADGTSSQARWRTEQSALLTVHRATKHL